MSVTCKLAKFKHRDLKEDESLSEDLTFIEGTFLGLTINPSSLCYINNKEIEDNLTTYRLFKRWAKKQKNKVIGKK